MNGLRSGDVFRTATNDVVVVFDKQLVPESPLVSVMMDDGIKRYLSPYCLRNRLYNVRDFDVLHNESETLAPRFLQILEMQNELTDFQVCGCEFGTESNLADRWNGVPKEPNEYIGNKESRQPATMYGG
jgi:hypothetical protein